MNLLENTDAVLRTPLPLDGGLNTSLVSSREGSSDTFFMLTCAHYLKVRQGHNYAFGSIGGFRFALYANCTWQLTAVGAAVPLAVGKVKAASTNPTAGWQELSLAVAGTKLTAAINNATVAVANSSAWADGYAGLSTGWHQAWFSTFEIQRA